MKNVRSSYLKRLPYKVSAKRMRTMPRRLGLIAVLAGIIGTPIFIIVTRLFPKESEAGKIFYWLHDHLYLPIKGYTYTLFYPFSISWWGPVVTILLVWLIAYLSMISVTRGFHVHVLRRVIKRNNKHRFLLHTTKWLQKWGFGALLLKEVAKQEREKSFKRLIAIGFNANKPDKEFKRLFHLTLFQINLYTLPRRTERDHLEAVLAWHETYRLLVNQSIRSDQSPSLNHWITQLANKADVLFPLLLNDSTEALFKESIETPPGFDRVSIMMDLYHLAAFYHTGFADTLKVYYIDENTNQIKNPDDYLNTRITGRLAHSIMERQKQIANSRIKIENIRNKNIPAEEFATQHTSKEWPLILDEDDEMAIWCRLALSISLNLAGLVGSPALALGFMEAIETLDFEMNCLTEEMKEAGLFHPMKVLPESADFRWCAELSEEELTAYESAWKKSNPGQDSLLSDDVFRLAKTRIRALYHASGPDYDHSTGDQINE
jgi:hypothetical protein